MQQRGWVATARASASGRSLTIAITDEGTATLARAATSWHDAQTDVRARLGDDAPGVLDAWLDGLGASGAD